MKKGTLVFAGIFSMHASYAAEIGHGTDGNAPLTETRECEGVIDCTYETVNEWFEGETEEANN